MFKSIEEQIKFRLMPASLYYPRKIRSEIASGEPELAILDHLISDRKGTAIDVGANRGIYSYALSKLCARVLAFEPNPELASFARSKLPPNVELHEVALGDAEGSATFHIPAGKKGDADHLSGTLALGRKVSARSFPVTVRQLDDFETRAVRFIKVDVEGTEMDVLRGATRTIRRDRPVLLLELLVGFYADPLEQVRAICDIAGHEACVADRQGVLRPVGETLEISKHPSGSPKRRTSRNVVFATQEHLRCWAEAGVFGDSA